LAEFRKKKLVKMRKGRRALPRFKSNHQQQKYGDRVNKWGSKNTHF
jgi:hypothetical protein